MEITPKKTLGQNFLINAGILEKIVDAAELNKDDTILEVGPGTGNLTRLLSEKAGRVIAVEKDHRLIEDLEKEFPAVKFIEGDILKLDINELFRNLKLEIRNSHYKVAGNIPYYITSHLLKTIFERWPKPKLMVLTIQKEVAQRIVAKPPDMNLLALSIQLYAEPKIIGYISKGSFRPIPKVDSAVVQFDLKQSPHPFAERVITLAKVGFISRRKQLHHNLLPYLRNIKPEATTEDIKSLFTSIGHDPRVRAENLTLDDWIALDRKIT